MAISYVNKLVKSVARSRERLNTQSRQRRGGVTDLYALDYVSEISNGVIGGTEESSSSSSSGEVDNGNIESRIKAVVSALKGQVPNATAEGIASIIGYFGIESEVKAQRYETDYMTDNQYDKMAKEPTAENLVGSWANFAGMYSIGLNEQGYLVDGKHWIGIGLGQWTGPRAKALWEKAKDGGGIFSFDEQIKFMLSEERLKDVVTRVATSTSGIDSGVTDFLANWGGVPGNKLAERIAFANKYLSYIKEVFDDPTTGKSDKEKDDGIKDIVDNTPSKDKGESIHRLLVPGDLDRFQRWFIKVVVSNNVEGSDLALTDVHMTIKANNSRTGESVELDVTDILKHEYPCDWIGSRSGAENIYPNDEPLEGYDLMMLAWYLDNNQRDILYSPGEKIVTIKAYGTAKITVRNFLKFSHIN